ncbi:MAG TPA: ABC transporter ATP-binding protein [Homoserinimonas sp.]|nr:ABC transporter ATP-binding protein [Homoserinimonas sp.]
MSDTALLEVSGLTAGYVKGLDILTDVNLTVEQGEIVGIFGPNGAGKSTLLKAVLGQVGVRSGSVSFAGGDVTGQRTVTLARKGIGYVPQLANVFSQLTVEENLKMGAQQDSSSYQSSWERWEPLFPGLVARFKARASSLSGGERQLLATARALMANPSLLLLDEPSAGLSPKATTEIFALLKRLCDGGLSMLIVEQNARRCLTICDRGYVLDQGKNAVTGTGAELLVDPVVVELYLGRLGGAGKPVNDGGRAT